MATLKERGITINKEEMNIRTAAEGREARQRMAEDAEAETARSVNRTTQYSFGRDEMIELEEIPELTEMKNHMAMVTAKINELQRMMGNMVTNMHEMGIAEYVLMWKNKQQLFWINFFIGIARGLGAAVGATIVFAIALKVAAHVTDMNLPVISDWVAQIMQMVEAKQGAVPTK